MGGNLYRRNDVSDRSYFRTQAQNIIFERIFQLSARIRRLALNWRAVVSALVLALFLAAPLAATPEDFFQDQKAAAETVSKPKNAASPKAAPQEFAPEEFVSPYGGSGLYQELDLPGASRAEVIPFRERWLSSWGRVELKTILENGARYRHYVKRRLQEEGLPSCIECIPVIESSYKPLAKPASGKSVGLWQFMENSIENYLVKNEWIDERRDPWKSTDAAIKKLKANYKQFDDWLLAIAAYNCGAGAVKRALKKTPQKTFWALSQKKLIPDHAIAYVPNLLAVSDITQNSGWYNVELPEAFYDAETYSPYDDFDCITVDKSVSLRALANEMRIDPQFLLELNPALIYEATPPGQKYELRLPSRMKESALSALFCLEQKLMYKEENADNHKDEKEF